MSSISFWTPVRYGTQATTLPQRARELVDGYFNLGRGVAVVCGKQLNGVVPVKIETSNIVWWKTALKVISYAAGLFCYAANFLFPGLPIIPGVVWFQIASFSCLPVIMVVMKAVLRAGCHFYRYENDQRDLIELPVKMTLDELLGGYGSVDRLPVYTLEEGESTVSPNKMTASMMKGIAVNPKDQYRNPFIAIQMRQLDNKRMGVLVFFSSNRTYPLIWDDMGRGSNGCPQFLSSTLTYHDTGGLTDSQAPENFPRLQKMIKEGKGKDLNGIEWEIINSQAEITALLNQLLGNQGPVDQLPEYKLPAGKTAPSVEIMTDPIMRGEIVDKKTQKKGWALVIKVRRLDTREERVQFLYRSNAPFAFSDPQADQFLQAQKLVQEGKNKGLHGIEWEIIGHQKK